MKTFLIILSLLLTCVVAYNAGYQTGKAEAFIEGRISLLEDIQASQDNGKPFPMPDQWNRHYKKPNCKPNPNPDGSVDDIFGCDRIEDGKNEIANWCTYEQYLTMKRRCYLMTRIGG